MVDALILVLAGVEGETVVGSSLSDSAGAFTVSASAGPAQLRVVADGYASWQRDIIAPGSGVRVVMALGGTIVGRVTDEASGRPLSGVSVQAARHDSSAGSFGRATTTHDGTFAIRDLGPGTHLVRMVDDDWTAANQEVWTDLGATAVADFAATRAGTVELTLTVAGEPCSLGGLVLHGPSPGAARVKEGGFVRVAGLKPGSYTALADCANALPAPSRRLGLQAGDIVREAWDLAAGLSVRGRVVGAAGEDTEGLTVRAFDLESGRAVECTTGKQGEFTCGGLVAGKYQCSVNNDDVELSDILEVQLTNDADSGEVELTLVPNGSVEIVLKDEQGRPLDQIHLALKAPGKIPLSGILLGGGRSAFYQIPVGRYDLMLEGSGTHDVQQHISVEQGKVTEVSWVLPTRDIEGWVLDAAGAAQPDTWVSAWGVSSLRGRAPEAEAMTNAEGRFLLERLVRSQYAMQIDGPGGIVLRNPVEVGETLTLYQKDQASSANLDPAQAPPESVIASQTPAASKQDTAGPTDPAKPGLPTVAAQSGADDAPGDVAQSNAQQANDE